jgi:hypothetical protein
LGWPPKPSATVIAVWPRALRQRITPRTNSGSVVRPATPLSPPLVFGFLNQSKPLMLGLSKIGVAAGRFGTTASHSRWPSSRAVPPLQDRHRRAIGGDAGAVGLAQRGAVDGVADDDRRAGLPGRRRAGGGVDRRDRGHRGVSLDRPQAAIHTDTTAKAADRSIAAASAPRRTDASGRRGRCRTGTRWNPGGTRVEPRWNPGRSPARRRSARLPTDHEVAASARVVL